MTNRARTPPLVYYVYVFCRTDLFHLTQSRVQTEI